MKKKDDFKVISYKGISNDNNKQIADNIKEISGLLPELLKLQKLKAKYKKASYNQYIEEGFTKEQALQIISTEKTPFDN